MFQLKHNHLNLLECFAVYGKRHVEIFLFRILVRWRFAILCHRMLSMDFFLQQFHQLEIVEFYLHHRFGCPNSSHKSSNYHWDRYDVLSLVHNNTIHSGHNIQCVPLYVAHDKLTNCWKKLLACWYDMWFINLSEEFSLSGM